MLWVTDNMNHEFKSGKFHKTSDWSHEIYLICEEEFTRFIVSISQTKHKIFWNLISISLELYFYLQCMLREMRFDTDGGTPLEHEN